MNGITSARDSCLVLIGVIGLAGSAWGQAAVNIRIKTTTIVNPPCSFGCMTTPHCQIGWFVNTGLVTSVNSCTYQINYYGDPVTNNIGQMTLQVPGNPPPDPPDQLDIFIGDGALPFPTNGAPMNSAAGDFAGMIINQDPLRASTRFAGRISGNFGTIRVGRLYRLDVAGSVGNITMDESPGNGLPLIFAGSTLADTTITCELGTIDTVGVAGNALGHIVAEDGGIENVLATNLRGNVTATDFIFNIDATGAIATSGGGAVNIETTGMNAPIGFVKGTSVNANITAGHSSDRGIVEWVKTTSGNLDGSITAQSLADPAAGVSVVDVAGSLTANITLPTGGLQGQIIVNGANSGGTWSSGSVTINTTTLSPMPYYTNVTSSQVGGGAVGLAPFRLYGKDCVPENGSTGAPPADNKLRMRFYGPLTWNPASGDPVTVEMGVAAPPFWQDITDDFAFQINPSNPRELILTPTTIWDLDTLVYRVTPTSNLKCAGVTGTPAVHNGVYQVTLH